MAAAAAQVLQYYEEGAAGRLLRRGDHHRRAIRRRELTGRDVAVLALPRCVPSISIMTYLCKIWLHASI